VNPHAARAATPQALIRSLWNNRSLIITLVRRDIEGRYRGSLFGILWSFLTPAAMVTVFTFVFGEIFQAKWANAQSASHFDFAAALFSGLLVYNFFAECMSRAPSVITTNPNYVKKIIFPLENLSVVVVLAALFHFVIAFAVVLLLIAVSNWQMTWTVLLTPAILTPLVLFTLGLNWLVSALGVYLRDIGQIISPVLTALMFLSPIFYPLTSVSPKFLWLYKINPLTDTIEQLRGALLHHQLPNPIDFGISLAMGLLVAWAGFAFFQKIRKGFSDVI